MIACRSTRESGASSPYLTVVVVGRNDDHGGDFLGRMQLFVDSLVALVERHRLASELLVVEWNPDPSREALGDVLRWPVCSSVGVRVVTVPPEVHGRLAHSSELNMFQMIAKNVGIRRARGEFVLATNADLLFSDELISHLASKPLRRGVLYRMARTDVPSEIRGATIDERLEYCAGHVLRIHGKYASYAPGKGPRLRRKVKVVLESAMSRLAQRPNYYDAFTNGAGDFTLLSREDWSRLRAYPELERYSLHLDALFCCAALGSGLDVDTFEPPMRMFHMEHEHGFGSFSARKKTNPHLGLALTSSEHRRSCIRLLAGKGLPWPDSADWGFPHDLLPERSFD